MAIHSDLVQTFPSGVFVGDVIGELGSHGVGRDIGAANFAVVFTSNGL